jgi:glycine/D-amino acid oxidase-like deaminating enzyme
MQQKQVIVLGAGVVGCAAAYYLARDGANVTIIEREAVGSGASGFAVGLLNPLMGTGIPGPMAPLAEQTFQMHKELWPEIELASGIDLQTRKMPHLQLCFTDDEVQKARQDMARWNASEGFSAEWLDPGQVLALDPRISNLVAGAVLLRHIWILDSYRLTLALLQSAEALGATLIHGEASGIESNGGQVTGVRVHGKTLACDAVVIALGPWSGQRLTGMEYALPVSPLKGQILHLEAPTDPFRYHLAGPGQVAHKADGLVWIASTEEEAGFDVSLTQAARDTLMARAIKMVPSLAELKLVRQTACIRPITPDRQPIVGNVPNMSGAYLATGAEKKGILFGPLMGRAVADLVMSGDTSLPIEPLSPERFDQ